MRSTPAAIIVNSINEQSISNPLLCEDTKELFNVWSRPVCTLPQGIGNLYQFPVFIAFLHTTQLSTGETKDEFQ
jgi:hypothetical protein